MSKKLKLIKLVILTIFCASYVIGLMLKPFKLILPNKEVINASIFDAKFNECFSSIKAFLMVLLVIVFIILIMLVICLIGELTKRPDDKDKKFLKVFGYFLEDKEIKQFSYILSGILLITFILHGNTYKGNTLLEIKLSCFSLTFYILFAIMIVTLVVVHLGPKKKIKESDRYL